MKFFQAITGPITLTILFLLPLQAGADGLGNARLSLVDGDVQIKPEDSSEWYPASINMPLREGDRVWVPDNGRAEMQLAGGPQIRLDEWSSLEILNLERDSAQFYLSAGSAYVNFRPAGSRLIQFDTPHSSIRAYDRSVFGVDVLNGDTDISVYAGSVLVDSGQGRTSVYAGSRLSIGGNYTDLAPLGRPDDWERWNMDRDRRYVDRRYSSAQYLPEELDTYAGDFDDNGRWVNIREYGNVWTPTVSISVGWTPYRHGRWCWIGGDYVWVGYEPWGWVPYHYGRWAFAASIGWFWVPPVRGAVYWGPGFVGWVSTPTYVAWVPLAPGETYYGYGHYGPHSVNILNVNVNKIVINKVYKNAYVNNSVTTVHHDTFVKGKTVDFRMRENPFLKKKAHIGRPNISPERETRMPVMKEISRGKEPPLKIQEAKIREIKERRRFVKDRNESVFVPDKRGRELNVRMSDAPKERKRDRTIQKGGDQDGRPAERRVSEEKEKKAAPPGKQRIEGGGMRIEDGKEMRQKEVGPAAKPVDRPSQSKKQRQLEQRGSKQPEKMQRERSKDIGKETPAADRQMQQHMQRQSEQREQQKQMEKKKPERHVAPEESSRFPQHGKEADRARESAPKQQKKPEDPRRQIPAVAPGPQLQPRQEDNRHKVREQGEKTRSDEEIQQGPSEQRGRGKGR